MGFSERIRRIEIANAKKCGACPEIFKPGAYIEVHSVTSLHLVLVNINSQLKYLVTDPPSGHEYLKGRTLNLNVYKSGEPKLSDGVCLCPVCHDEIHRVAFNEAKQDEKFSGKAPSPKLMEEVSLHFIKRGRPLVYENVAVKVEV